MKKNYINPNIKVIDVHINKSLLVGSNENLGLDNTPIDGENSRSKSFYFGFDDEDF